MLSVRTSSIAQVLERLAALGASECALLTLALAYERALGKASRWSAYLETVPLYEPLPLLWSDEELRSLRGTGLDDAAGTRRRELSADYSQLQQALRALRAPSYPEVDAAADGRERVQTDASADTLGMACEAVRKAVSETAYVHAATLTWSRAFHLGSRHGEALVPLAPGRSAEPQVCAASRE